MNWAGGALLSSRANYYTIALGVELERKLCQLLGRVDRMEQGPVFSSSNFQRFCEFYVHGFYRAVEWAASAGDSDFAALYPSTCYLDEFHRNTIEYSAAKAAGEILCEHLQRAWPRVRVVYPRLPRMETDQTAGIFRRKGGDAVEVILSLVRGMQIED